MNIKKTYRICISQRAGKPGSLEQADCRVEQEDQGTEEADSPIDQSPGCHRVGHSARQRGRGRKGGRAVSDRGRMRKRGPSGGGTLRRKSPQQGPRASAESGG